MLEHLLSAISRVHLRRSVLFVGAGFSKDATNILGRNMLLGSKLAHYLATELEEDTGTDLETISSLLIETFDRQRLLNIIQQEFRCDEASTAQKTIISLPWKRIYTTNYDDVVENCLGNLNIDFQVVTRSDRVSTIDDDKLTCVHLNGYIHSIDENNFDDEILLTDFQYLTITHKFCRFRLRRIRHSRSQGSCRLGRNSKVRRLDRSFGQFLPSLYLGHSSVHRRSEQSGAAQTLGFGRPVFLQGLPAAQWSPLRMIRRWFCHPHRARNSAVTSDLFDDISFLEKLSKECPILLYISDYYSYERMVDSLRAALPNVNILTTSSSAARELRSRLPRIAGENYFEVELNRLDDADIEKLDNVIESYGYWGELAGMSSLSRQRFVKKKCARSLRSVILTVFDHEAIRRQISEVFSQAESDSATSFSCFVKVLALGASGYQPSFKEVCEILGVTFANRFMSRDGGWTSEFFEHSSGRQVVKSSIFAQYLLRNFVSDRAIMDHLVYLAEDLDNKAEGNPLLRKLKTFPLESVRRLYVGLQSFRSMSRMDASLMKASALRLRFSQSLASRRQRLSQAMVRSTTQRLGWTTKPFTRSDRLTISVSRSGRMPARAR